MKKYIETLTPLLSEKDTKRFLEAFLFAQKAHGKQKRKSGEPYIIHPVAVAQKLWEKFNDIDLAIAGLLHDTTEDNPKITLQEVHERFGGVVGFLVDAVDKNQRGFYSKVLAFEDKIERFLWAGMQDVRVLLLKIADREHNIETLEHLQNDKQVRMAFETQAVFNPLKHILDFNKKHTVEESKILLTDYLKEEKISDPRQMKQCLYTVSFKDFSHEMFDLVYNNSHKVVWEIEDKNYFEELSQNNEFEKHVRIENMWTNGEHFKASFTFDKGYILEPGVGLKVSSYKHT